MTLMVWNRSIEASPIQADRSASQRASLSPRIIALVVAVVYFSASLYIYRGIAAGIPSILDGRAVINGDELVPFFNPTSQLLDQAAGKFNHLTNGYEFRVRYSFLTTWMRYYKVLPFAIIIVLPAVTFVGYLAVAKFLSAALDRFSPSLIHAVSAGPVAFIYIILAYSKITHFYTLILGFSVFLVAATLMTYGLIFAQRRAYRLMAIACIVTLLNPAVHYLILFALYLSITVAGIVLVEILTFIRSGWLRRLRHPRQLLDRSAFPGWRQATTMLLDAPMSRAIISFVFLGALALVPYALFVKYVALRGVPNLSETVPGDFYFITDASIPFLHMLSWDMAGIMDKIIGGDYLSKEPRKYNILYSVLLLLPLAVPTIRRSVFNTRARQVFLFVAYLNIFFSMWATLGYSGPEWALTFHRVLALISRTAYGMQSTLGDLVVKLTSTIVQVLRFPHRFQLILFMMACVIMPIPLAWFADRVQTKIALWNRRAAQRFTPLLYVLLFVLFFVPLFSHQNYRQVFSSGNYLDFLEPYPVTPLKEIKEVLDELPEGKVVVLPPTETAKVIVDSDGIEHKFIDKFHIYYLDKPSFYYGLTGDSDNKFEFFLLLRALYYQQDWWLNIARDINMRYIVVNKELIGNTVGGAEYLREIEKIILPEFDAMPEYLHLHYENDSYALYELTDLPKAERPTLFIDTSWSQFIQVLSSRPDLTRYYDLRYTTVSDDLTDFDNLTILSDNPHSTNLDLYVKANPAQFAGPSSSIFAFEPNVIPSSYYLSPMFRLFQFFSDSKWNRLNMITPGLFGTVKGSFVGFPRETQFRIDAKFPEDGAYRVLMRGAVTANHLTIRARSLDYESDITLMAEEGALSFYDQETVFEPGRQPMDVSAYSLDEIERLIPSEIVAVNYRYQYHDLGVIDASKGTHTFYVDKYDNSPLLVEGLLIIPEEDFQHLELPENTRLLDSHSDLCCTTVDNQKVTE